MKADLTRDTFDAAKHYSRVLMQQGRVTLDADWNEQVSILLYTMRTMAADIIGPFAGPVNNCGFQLQSGGVGSLALSTGRYYVDGILVEIDSPCTYNSQPFYTPPASDPVLTELGLKSPTTGIYWLYLDVWEWHLTYISDSDIREVALNGPDTCTRSMVIWQVKGMTASPGANGGLPLGDQPTCQTPLKGLLTVTSGLMEARVNPGQTVDTPCITPPSAQYRGAENQLYRVEVHNGGPAGTATFKWSRDNGSVVTALLSQSGNVLTVSHARGFEAGNWVELLDDNFEMQILPGTLVKLLQAGNGTLTVDPSSLAGGTTLDQIYGGLDQTANPRVRRWDLVDTTDGPLTSGAIPLVEATSNTLVWIDLEDGVQVAFRREPNEGAPASQYRTGDYWLIPARVATGDIEWPTITDPSTNTTTIVPMPPNGIEHHYAPLGFVTWGGGNFQQSPCVCTFQPTATCTAGQITAPEQRVTVDDPIDFDVKEKADVEVVAAKRAARKSSS